MTLLDKDRFRWAAQGSPMESELRRKHCRGFLTKGLEKKPPTREQFTAYAARKQKKGDNAVGATRKQLLGRISVTEYRAESL